MYATKHWTPPLSLRSQASLLGISIVSERMKDGRAGTSKFPDHCRHQEEVSRFTVSKSLR